MSSASSHRVERGPVNETAGPINPTSVELDGYALEMLTGISAVRGSRRVSTSSKSSDSSADGLNGLS